MQYIAPVHRASSVVNAFVCDLTAPGSGDLVLNKCTRIEIHKVHQTSTSLVSEFPINGVLTCLQPVLRPGDSTAILLCATSLSDFFAVAFRDGSLQTITAVNTTELSARSAERGQLMLVDPLHQAWVALHSYHGLLRIAKLREDATSSAKESKKRSGKRKASQPEHEPVEWVNLELDFRSSFDVRLPDYQIHDIKVLHLPFERLPLLAILHDDPDGQRSLKLRSLSLEEKEFVDHPPHASAQATLLDDPGSNLLIPFKDGVIVVGEQLAYCYQLLPPAPQEDLAQAEDNDSDIASSPPRSSTSVKGKARRSSTGPIKSSRSNSGAQKGKAGRKSHEVYTKLPLGIYTTYCAWTACSAECFLLGDQHGNVIKLDIRRSADDQVTCLDCTPLAAHAISVPTSLVPLADSRLFVSSHSGDAQLFHLSLPDESGSGGGMEVEEVEPLKLLNRQTNLAPIVDFVVVENEVGQSHMVACSGYQADGSLRIINHGVSLSEVANFELEQVQRVWSLQSSDEDILVFGFVNRTMLLRLPANAEEIEELDALKGFATDTPTLDAFTLPHGSHIQVTPSGISATSATTWSPPSKIAVSTHLGEHLLLGLEGAKLALVQATHNESSLQQLAIIDLSNEASALSLQQVAGGKTIAAVALWSSHDILLFDLPDLSQTATISAASSIVIRSIQIATFASDQTLLFAGLGDGTLLSYALDPQAATVVDSSRKAVALGSRPIVMTPYCYDDEMAILASSDQPTLITRRNGRTNYASINLKDITALCSLASSQFPNSLVLASSDTVRIGRIDDVQSLNIRNILLGQDQPRRIAYSADLGTYGLLCTRESFDESTGEEISSSTFKIVDETTFNVLLDYEFQEDEEATCVACVRPKDSSRDVFVTGSGTLLNGEIISKRGRLVIFRSTDDHAASFQQAAELSLAGAPYSVASLADGHVVAAVNASVHLHLLSVSDGSGELAISELAQWGGSFLAQSLAVRGQHILVGDALRSVTLLECVKQPSGTLTLNEVAREHSANGIMSVQFIDDDHYIAVDLNLNLFTMSKAPTGGPNAGKLQLEGLFHLGEMVTKIVPGTLIPSFSRPNAFKSSQLLFTTSSGTIGIISALDAASSAQMSNLQRNMSVMAPSIGGLDHSEYRKFKGEFRTAESVGFVDGSLVQTFVGLDSAHLDMVMKGQNEAQALTDSVAQLSDAVEDLSRAHS